MPVPAVPLAYSSAYSSLSRKEANTEVNSRIKVASELPAPLRETSSLRSPSSSGKRARARRFAPRKIILITMLAAVIIAAQLMLSAQSGGFAHRMSSLSEKHQQLELTKSDLSQRLSIYNSPQYLLAHLQQLGMISGSDTTFVRLSDGSAVPAPPGPHRSVLELDSAVPNALLQKSGLVPGASTAAGVSDGTSDEVTAILAKGRFPAPTLN